MPPDTDTSTTGESPESGMPADPLKVPDEHADDEATREAFRDGFARALLLVQSSTTDFLRLATMGAEKPPTDALDPPATRTTSSGLADLMDEIGDDATEEPDDDRPQQLGADNI